MVETMKQTSSPTNHRILTMQVQLGKIEERVIRKPMKRTNETEETNFSTIGQ